MGLLYRYRQSFAAALTLVLGLTLHAQTAPPAQGGQESEQPLLRFQVNLVQVDVVVTDKRGHHVTGLRPADFEVFQNGSPKQISHLEYISASPRTAAPQAGAVPTGGLSRKELRRTFLFYIDDVRISFLDFALLRAALLRFVDEQVRAGDLCAVYRTSGGPGSAQAFSADRLRVRAVVERMKWQGASAGISATRIVG